MTTLEIIMLVIGIICFIASFLLTSEDSEPVNKKRSNYKPELTKEQIEQLSRQVDEIVSNQMSMMEESTEGALDKISNTKILEMNEYAEMVLAEINKNHNETVFMYDMLNEKAKEVKDVIKEVNNVKAHIDAVDSGIQEDSKYLEGLLKEAEKTVKELDIAIKAAYKTKLTVNQVAQETKPVINNILTPQFAEEKESVFTEENVNEVSYMAKVEPEVILASNCNEEILRLHSMGKSNLEIAKTLNLGMGEVKLVIDLFNKNK